MPAKIVQTNNEKFNRVKLDPITLDVIENSMFSARWEMDAVLFRTAMSPGIREQGDE
ncbi:MAG TPA: hydantoinase B/oxoprolinase family protein, partial [Gammaproteobacteria bacterium]|nr:hydantoinase B/oxoprolinase family protein [Gammaproteobacteria bacterium]